MFLCFGGGVWANVGYSVHRRHNPHNKWVGVAPPSNCLPEKTEGGREKDRGGKK